MKKFTYKHAEMVNSDAILGQLKIHQGQHTSG